MRIKLFLTFLIISFQAACTANLNNQNELAIKENELRFRVDYNSYLSLEYLQYSRNLAAQDMSNEADYFAIKGLRASNNYEIYPEVPENWNLNPAKVEEAVAARKTLELLTNPEIKQNLPIQLAHLMMLYDCWLSNEQKDWNLSGLVKCKARFLKLADEIEDYMRNLKQTPKEVVASDEKEPDFRKFEIYFDSNNYKLNSDANQEFLELIEYLESLNGDFRILLSGNSDRKGGKIYNDVLSRKRVLVVKDLLIKNGVPNDLIEMGSTGENNSEIITKDGKQNKYNRLVKIYILKGNDSLAAIPLPLIDNYIYKKEIENLKKNKGLNAE